MADIKQKIVILEEDMRKLGIENGKTFVRENAEKLPEEFGIKGRIYIEGFMQGLQEEYIRINQDINEETEEKANVR